MIFTIFFPVLTQYILILPVLGPNLEIALWMVAYRADFRSFLAYHDVSTVAALPDGVTLTREYDAPQPHHASVRQSQ